MRVDTRWRGIVLTPAAGPAANTDTYCLITLLPRDKANAYAAGRLPARKSSDMARYVCDSPVHG